MRHKSLFTISALAALPLALALANPGQAESEKDERQQHEEAAEPPANRGPDRTPERLTIQHPSPPPPIADRNEQDTKHREEEAIEREKADLIAQQGMNAATQEINLATQDMRGFAYLSAIAAIASAIIAFFSFGVMAFTILLLRSANKAAYEAVNAGNEGVRATREIGKAQAQAYVHIDKAELLWGSDRNPAPRFILTAINTGMTPARWFECEATAFSREIDHSGKHKYKISFCNINFTDANKARWNALGSGKETTLPAGRDKSTDIIIAYRKTDKSINIAGTLRYETFFGEIFESEFWFVVGPHHEYRCENITDPGSIYTYREIPTVMRRAEGSLRTYEKIESPSEDP